jgi:protein phosphatase
MQMNSSISYHRGLVRLNNEDYILTDNELGIYIVADGMGGHNAGEVASELAVSTAFAYLSKAMSAYSDDDPATLLRSTILKAHATVLAGSYANLMCKGMGTTLVIAMVDNGQVHICHVGDSRAYLFSSAKVSLLQVTTDHTVAEKLIRDGILSKDKMPPHYWHTLTQAVGIDGPEPVPDYSCHPFGAQDTLLLCSDGLTDMLDDAVIATILSAETSLSTCAQHLLDAALANGGKDNVSIILIKESPQ